MGQDSIAGKTALVTGAARRLGRATALALADEGANVVVHYRSSQAEAEDLRRELGARGVKAWALQGDLGKENQSEGLVQRAIELAGPIHILINNASTFDPSTLDSVVFDEVLDSAAVNAWAPFVLSRAFARQGIPGRIVNLLDTRAQTHDRAHVAYILSKHMLAALTRMTALEYAPDVTVNAVAPGLILPPPGEDESYLERAGESLPLKRHGDAEDVAAAVLFLVKSRFITGQVIYVDGGHHLRAGEPEAR